MIVRAPATSANLGPGFDCVGVALDLWNELEVTEGNGVEVEGLGEDELALNESNLGVRAYARLADPAGKRFRFVNRIPLERGLGSSAAAIALGLVAAAPTTEPEELLATALELEPHADNLAATLVGGVTLVCDGRIARIASSLPLTPVAVVPDGRTPTQLSRDGLPTTVPHADAALTAGHAALLGAAVASGDPDLFARALVDRLHEPYRPSAVLDAVRADLPPRRPRRHPVRVGADRHRLGRRARHVRGRAEGKVSRARCARAESRDTWSPRVTVRLVDCRSRDDYLAGHIPGSVHLDPEVDLTGEIGDAGRGRHPLPEPGELAESFGRAGISDDTFVLALDSGTGWAARCWWLLRHLGHDACGTFDMRAYNGPLETGDCPRRGLSPARFVPRARTDDVIEADEILARLGDPSLVLYDARSLERWRGDAEPLDPVAGRIPGARNAYFEEPLPTGATEPPEVAAYCGSGVTAAVVVQRLVLAGREDARLYPGSFSEWCRRTDTPIETGDPAS